MMSNAFAFGGVVVLLVGYAVLTGDVSTAVMGVLLAVTTVLVVHEKNNLDDYADVASSSY